MGATLLALLLSAVLLLAALGGPWLLRQTAPALASAPRLAAAGLTATALLWIAALVALGPLVAWMSGGPAWLPEAAAAVCERCLVAASPFGATAVSLGIPAIVPLALPALGGLAIVAGLVIEFVSVRRAQSALGATLRETATPMTVLGHRVLVTPSARADAFSLPCPRGGIVLSRGAITALSSAELSAVLEHERAHLAQRHHLCLAILAGATRFFRWVPLIRAVRDAVPLTLEIAADQAAQRRVGTTALAGALLKLGQPPAQDRGAPVVAHAALHAAGSERIRHLVGHTGPPASLALATAAGAYAVMLATAALAVHWPYWVAVLTGC